MHFVDSWPELPPPQLNVGEIALPVYHLLYSTERDPTLACLGLNATSWDDQPRVWQNFVLQTLPHDRPNYVECWRIVKKALAKWELHMPERNLVCGTPEHMLLWRLAYE